MKKYTSKKFGPIPHRMISKTLGIDLEPGGCYISARSHKHIAEDHPGDYRIVWPNLERVVTEPSYIGRAPHHGDGFEMVKRIRVREEDEGGKRLRQYHVLAAVSMERDKHGDYRIKSSYLIKEEDVTSRRLKNRLHVPKK